MSTILRKVVFLYYRPQTKFAKVMFLQVCVCPRRGEGWSAWQILRDTVNERAVRILLECILVLQKTLLISSVFNVISTAGLSKQCFQFYTRNFFSGIGRWVLDTTTASMPGTCTLHIIIDCMLFGMYTWIRNLLARFCDITTDIVRSVIHGRSVGTEIRVKGLSNDGGTQHS